MKFLVELEGWDMGSLIITVNGEPVGQPLGHKNGIIIRNWLRGSINAIAKIVTKGTE